MIALTDRRFRLSPGEIVIASTSEGVQLSVDGLDAAKTNQVEITAPAGRSRVQLRVAASDDTGQVHFQSNEGGGRFTAIVPRGQNLFEFVIEPQPDEWYCESLEIPPHPVSKNDATCPVCGLRVLHGGR
jgi:hypothetical protein